MADQPKSNILTAQFGARQLPQSDALQEAGSGGESLAELLSRDPAGYSRLDRDRVVRALQDQRERWAKLEAKGGAGGKKPAAPSQTRLTPEDLGI